MTYIVSWATKTYDLDWYTDVGITGIKIMHPGINTLYPGIKILCPGINILYPRIKN
jgi:hypothetical protein